MGIGEWIRRRGERRMDAELRFHLESLTEDYERQGLGREEAERRARGDFGPVDLAKDECRDQWLTVAVEHLGRDVRFGLRSLRKSPGFTVAAILTLALGVGANTAIYQLFDAVRLRTLPVDDPHELVVVELADRSRWKGRRTSGYPVLSNPLWEVFREHQTTFPGVLAWANTELRIDRDASSPAARGLFVSGGFFDVLGVAPLLGRTFGPADDRPGCDLPGIVISYGFWQRRFGGDPSVVGRTLTLDARPAEVIGVTPPGFHGVEVGRAYDVAVPICAQAALGSETGWLESRTTWWLTVMGRLAPGQPLDAVNAQLDVLSAGLFEATVPPGFAAADVRDYQSLRLRAVPGSGGVSALRTRYGRPLLILLAATGLILLIACTNLANLILSRASAREREFAVRLAVGASRGRLLSQLMVENGLLAIGGAAAGLVIAVAASRFLVGVLGEGLSLELPLDARVLLFVASVAGLMCLAFGLVPAWRASRATALDAMQASGRSLSSGREGARLRQALVVAQVALSFVLLFGALLFAGTLRNLLGVDAGFEPDGVVVARLDYSRRGIPRDDRAAFKRGLLEQIRAAPGVVSAAEVRHLPLGGTGSSIDVWPDGADPASRKDVRLNAMSDGYLDTMGIPLLAGRDFTRRDGPGAPYVAMVNPSLARRLGLEGNPVGATFRAEGPPSEPEVVFQIVGLVPDTKYFSLREEALPIAFAPLAQIGDPRSYTDFVIRTQSPPDDAVLAVRRAVASLPDLEGVELRAFDATIRDGLLRERLLAALSAGLGILATLIVAVGLYGVMSYLVGRRTNEIGVRIALGAQRAQILGMVLRQGLTLLFVGLAAGAVLALALAGFAQSLVFGLQPWDLRLVTTAGAALAAVAAGASYLPARRAARMAPLQALRHE